MVDDRAVELVAVELWPRFRNPGAETWKSAADRLRGAAETIACMGAEYRHVEALYTLAGIARHRATLSHWADMRALMALESGQVA